MGIYLHCVISSFFSNVNLRGSLQRTMFDGFLSKNCFLKSNKDTLLSDLKECRKEKAGNNMEACAQQMVMQDTQADMMLGIYDKMMCVPGRRYICNFNLCFTRKQRSRRHLMCKSVPVV